MTMSEEKKETIAEREAREEAPYRTAAAVTGKPQTFIASDGCQVTILPNGTRFFNVEDWY